MPDAADDGGDARVRWIHRRTGDVDRAAVGRASVSAGPRSSQ